MFKRLLAMLILVALMVPMLAACGGTATPTEEPAPTEEVEETEEPAETEEVVEPTAEPTETEEPVEEPSEVTMYDGIYENRFTPEGYDEFVGYFHFYPNGVFYLSLYSGGQYAAGYYEIVDEGVEWYPNIEENDDMETVATTDKKIILTNFDGSDYAVVGYDSEQDMVVNLESYYSKNFVHVLDSGHTPADETGVNVIEYYIEGDEYSMVALKHNGTFQDSVGMIIEGTWEKDGNVYTLTDGDTGDTYTITVNEDGTATYVAVDGTTQTLVPPQTAEVQLTFTGVITAAYGEMAGTTYLYDDNTAVLEIAYAGTTNTIEGTWELAEDYSLNLTLDGTDYTIPLNPETQQFGDFEFVTSDGVDEVTLVMSQVVEEAAVQYTWVGTSNPDVILEMYSDGTCALIYQGMGTVTEGTWTVDPSASPVPAWTIELKETFEDEPIEVTTDYETGFFFTFKNGSGQLEETLTLTFEEYQAVEQ